MIKNERQYRITRAQAGRFEKTIVEAKARTDQAIHPRLRKGLIDGLRSQLGDLKRELRAYEALRSGSREVFPLRSIEELPKVLIQARIASGLSQEELASRLGLKPQQIQRYEAADYRSASLERVSEIVHALGVKLRHPAELKLVS